MYELLQTDPPGGVQVEALIDYVSTVGTGVLRVGHSVLAEVGDALHDVSSSIEGMADDHFIEHHSQRPHIALFAVDVHHESLWSHVAGRPYVVKDFRFGYSHNLAVSKVAD